MASLSIEEENYVRLALLLKGVTPRAVRSYFDREFPPTSLPSTLSTSHNTLLDLKVKRIINQAQWNLLIPRNGVPDSKTFDVTLMICLIRNLTSISPPINGFDSLPLPGETTPGSDLARIKCYRNKLAHHDSNKIDTAYSNTAWRDISDAVCRLGGQIMYQECQELKVKILDQSNQEIILEIQRSLDEMKELRQTINNLGMEHSNLTKSFIQLQTSHSTLQTEHFTVAENLIDLQTSHSNLQTSHSTLQTVHSTVTEKLIDIQTSTSTLQTSHSTLQTEHLKVMESLKDPVPWNIREQIDKQIKDWECKDKMFVSTRASDYVMECLNDNNCVTLTAPSGVGKSFIARHTALLLKNEGYRIIPVYIPTDVRTYYQPGKPTIFVIDDICGNFIADQYQIGNWKQLLPVINTVIADKSCKIIVSCRLQVYKDDKFNILLPFKSCECNLISNKLCLSYIEKNAIAKSYIGSSLYDIDKLSQKCDFFPLLCSLYKGGNNGDVEEFFKNPFNVYQNELDNLSRYGDEGILRICSLALCVIFDNQLEEEQWFEGKLTNEQKHIIEDICDACEINRITSKAKLKKALDTLDGTFICKQNGIYKTVHDKLFDFLAHYFGQKMIRCLIDHGDSDLVRERFVWEKSLDNKKSYIDFIIKIPDKYLESYLERFVKDWSAGMVSDVLSNINMEDSLFRQQLLQYLQKLDNFVQVALVNTKDTVRPKESCASGNTPLILTCYYGYTDMVQWLVHNDAVVNQCRDDGITGLVMASQNGHTVIVKLLLEKNHNVDLYDKNGCCPLRQASQNGHTDIVKLLFEKDPNVDLCDNDGYSPLCWASQEGHNDAVVNQCRDDGITGLVMASQNGHTVIVKLLLEKNHNVDLYDKNGCCPLRQASQNGHTDIVKLLFEKDPNVDLCDNDGYSPLCWASQEGHNDADVDQCRDDVITGLVMASQNGHTDIVKLLLEKNHNVDLCDKNGCSPLRQASQNGHTDIVTLLLEKNPNIDLCDKDSVSPLCWASFGGHTDIVFLLLEKNPNVDLCDKDGVSPLCWASYNGHADIVKLLLERNPNVDLCNKEGFTPLITACIRNNTSMVQLLMKHKPNINAQTYDGGNALFFSALNGNLEITRLLLKKNADCNISCCSKQFIIDTIKDHPTKTLEDEKQCYFDYLIENASSHVTDYVNKKPVDYVFDIEAGCSPLHIACFMDRIDIVCCLLDHNANINMTNEDGATPLFFACEVGHEDIVCLLLDKGADTQICRLDSKSPLQIATDNEHTSIVMIVTEHLKKKDKPSS
ncbi:unnamed protein product [Mytilus coruscus]|uniref:Uncharacterized protein n=1 Tax=Mytilus coruscus TaxID=42192 RepID=A0A6J8ETT1_MYTCO|nr:unnamed protein product [Mytilus coruscus]